MDLEHENKIKYKCINETKCKVYTVLHLVLLVKKKNLIPKKIYLMVGIWKIWYYKKLLTIEKINLNAVIIPFYFQCTQMMMNSISSLWR